MAKQTWKPGNMLYPLPAVMVTVADKEGRDNIITIAWTGTVCTNPPMTYISVRPERYSHHMLKETGEFIGDCGITMQNIDGVQLPEIGYHVHRNHWRKGYGSEAAKAVRDWAFTNRNFDCLYSYMTQSNTASWSTAAAVGMHRVKEYTDERYFDMYVYAISREEWEKR